MPNYKSPKTDNSKSQQLTVVVRIRPLFDHEAEKGASKIARKADNKMVLLQDPTAGDPVDILRAKRAQEKKYVFDWAFDEDSTQEDVYEKTTKTLVENVVDGFNGTVFAYGATGSGKTHTMVGVDDDPGIMVRALKDLFKEVDMKNKIYNVSMSYLEVMSLLMRGNKRRTQESTGANATSSRSHAVLVVQVKKRSPAHSHEQVVRTGRLYMVDLAGSERAAQTQNTGKRLLEGAHINKSLLALGNCINALAERNTRYVNFRDSKLTRILKEPLAGNCKTVMVGHISPSHFHFEESRNTLAYADRAKNITTKLRSNVSDVSYHVAQYQSIINELRQEIAALHKRIQGSNYSSFKDGEFDGHKEEKKLTDDEMKLLKKQLISSFNSQMDVRRRMMEIDNALLAQSIEFDKLGMIISEWETEKAVSALENEDEGISSESDNKNNAENDMPEHIRNAWEELQFIKSQHQRYIEMREDCDTDYKSCKQKTHSVTESLSEKASSREQRELLHLLTRVYELEIEKLEMQSSQLSREHELRCRDLMILRYDRQRQLCDEIITKQRILIDALATGEKAKNVNARKELNELYRIYQQEIQDLNGDRNSNLGQTSPFGSLYRPPSSGLRPLGSSGSMLELHHLDLNKNSDSGIPNPLPPIGNNADHIDNERRLFMRRKRQPFRRGSDEYSGNSQLPPLLPHRRAQSRFSNSSNSTSSLHERRSGSIGSQIDSTTRSSSNGRSSDSSDYNSQRLHKLDELDEPLKKRFGILPSLKNSRRRDISSDSELLSHSKLQRSDKGGTNGNKKLHPDERRRHEITEDRRTKQQIADKTYGY
nr:kinesin-like protein KIF19 [Parasteatoda tepidariorum]